MSAAAKNCNTCRYLEWVDGECTSGADSGFVCNGREITSEKQEAELLAKLDNEVYRSRYKRCFESKGETK